MGATLVAAVLCRNELFWISAGDSRAYLVRAGRLYRLTSDHTYGNELDDDAAAGRIDPQEAALHPDRGSVTSGLGMPEPPTTDCNVEAYLLMPGDRVLLCTDGLYRTLTDSEISNFLSRDLQIDCENLIRRVEQKKLEDQDNVTVVMMAPAIRRVNWTLLLRRAIFATVIIVNLTLLALLANKLRSMDWNPFPVRRVSIRYPSGRFEVAHRTVSREGPSSYTF
jgi:sulfur transfer complex TusBCD TusB component (DsrH family)